MVASKKVVFQHYFQRGDRPFQMIERINASAYKLDVSGDYNVSAGFNVAYLSPFDVGKDLMTNPFQKKGDDDENHVTKASQDELNIHRGPMTRQEPRK